MIELRSTSTFTEWLAKLKDVLARARIADRLKRLSAGNPGNSRSVGAGVVELKIDVGPGYRVYYIERGSSVILLLCGGDKSSQEKDLAKAKSLAQIHQ